MPSPLVVQATQETGRYQTATTDALAAFGSRQAAQTAAEVVVGTRTAELADLAAQIAAVRAALAAVPMPADGDPLLVQLATLLAALHNKQGESLTAQTLLAQAKASTARASAELTRAQQQLAAATANEARVKAEDAERLAWVAALSQPPLDTLKADATAALTAAPFTTALARVDTNVPAELRTRARERYVAQRARITAARAYATAAEDRATQEQADAEGASGDVAQKTLDFNRAAAALRAYVATAKERLDRAIALAEGVLASPQLTTQQKARVTDTALTTPGITAAGIEKDRDLAAAAVAAKQALYDDAVLAALVDDPDTDPTTAADVITAQTALTTAVGDLTTKQGLYTPAVRADLDKWEAALPDTMWKQLAAVEDARAILTELGGITAASLTGPLTAAESALVLKLDAAAARRRAAAILQDTVTERGAGLDAVLSALQDAQFSATRGDLT